MNDFCQEPTFIPGKRKYLFCADQKGMGIFHEIIGKMKEINLAYEVRFIESTDISHWLSQQQMGSYLYVAAPFEQIKYISHLAHAIGFTTEEEAQYISYGVEKRNVFCCRCHGLTEIEISQQVQYEIQCLHCKLQLAISDHYSSLRDAYLGYIAKL
ncbi:dimethylamine monooxygenase subunit DmmA family protein [Peribacillus alkalitolerans]|uniref:dimethylamine monooxygenase subunit DmmA family protein n=1 Tax=Peribacillus alkalitolerans TaxID=1550385 RepID=UPI0013D1DEEB|nr:dimethylamine monooxygenase subunit DmmA family protein [Peribacillus alkalitolerans]